MANHLTFCLDIEWPCLRMFGLAHDIIGPGAVEILTIIDAPQPSASDTQLVLLLPQSRHQSTGIMASVDHIPPPMTTYVEPPRSNITAPPMASRADSMTTDMHIPGAWNGTNPGTPAPIGEDIKYFGQTLKTVPGTVQSYLRECGRY
jgi:hypothetical protein